MANEPEEEGVFLDERELLQANHETAQGPADGDRGDRSTLWQESVEEEISE
jgi:hypothetical protein